MGLVLDRLVLHNTRHALPADHLSRRWLHVANRRVELFQWASTELADCPPPIQVVKFIGAAGRAENLTNHPLDVWTGRQGTISVVNPPGYGQSPGRPRLDELVEMGQATVEDIHRRAPHSPLVLMGSSLGGAVAICTAALAIQGGMQPRGLIVRDAPSLRDVIWQRLGWKSGWLPARLLIRSIPASLDLVGAAQRCSVPAVIVMSLRDKVVPPAAQRAWVEHYAGPKRVIELPHAGHYEPLGKQGSRQYREALEWLEHQLPDPQPCPPATPSLSQTHHG